ncbi:MAG: beta-galactosidase [Bifidobacterium sp.]
MEALNKAWCANFWSHTIYDWGDVVPARRLRRRHQRRQMRGVRAADGLSPLPKPGAVGLLYERARRDPRIRRDHADHHEPHGHVQGCSTTSSGPRRWTWSAGTTIRAWTPRRASPPCATT